MLRRGKAMVAHPRYGLPDPASQCPRHVAATAPPEPCSPRWHRCVWRRSVAERVRHRDCALFLARCCWLTPQASGSTRRGAVRVHADVSRRDTLLGAAALLVRLHTPRRSECSAADVHTSGA